ncbi:hypothetical protein DM860_012317 [Cuscuta australis]|uniref:Reverse transcriptase zinc-binding domain-containing protein n=1 Tax=Cuscuta australis TaxID=267555 RepID=A0A328DPW6_9ASTE|nr:hypothetical protein DM860_012317 [Cuscuta australis]
MAVSLSTFPDTGKGKPPGKIQSHAHYNRPTLFAELLKIGLHNLPGNIHGFYNGAPSISFSHDEDQALAKPLSFSLVGRCSSRANIQDLEGFLVKGGFSEFKLRRISNRNILFIFKREGDYLRWFSRRRWSINGLITIISKWTPSYSPSKESPFFPVWVQLNQFPAHLNDHAALYQVASLLGKPLKVDSNTSIGVYPSKPRFCVERDLSLPLPDRIHIRLGSKDLWVPCGFENPPIYCSTCSIFGHSQSACRKKFGINVTGVAPFGDVGYKGARKSRDPSGWKEVRGRRRQGRKLEQAVESTTNFQQSLFPYSTSNLLPNTSLQTASAPSAPVGGPSTLLQPHKPDLLPIPTQTPPTSSSFQPHKPSYLPNPSQTPPSSCSLPLPTVEDIPEDEAISSGPPSPILSPKPLLNPPLDDSLAIIPYIPPSPKPCNIDSLISKDDYWISKSYFNPLLQLVDDAQEEDHDLNPLYCHSDGHAEDRPFDTSEIRPLAFDASHCSSSSLPFQKFKRSSMPRQTHNMETRSKSNYSLKLGFPNHLSSNNNKRWMFWDPNQLLFISAEDEDQVTHCLFSLPISPSSTILISSIYGSHKVVGRRLLWGNLQHKSSHSSCWVVGGDFNVISSLKECKGQLCPNTQGMDEFNSCIESCNLLCPDPSRGLFTWSGTRSSGKLWRRLDRILVNLTFQSTFSEFEVQHLPRACSDHKALLLSYSVSSVKGPSAFRFLNPWIHHTNFLSVVKECWNKCPTVGGMHGLVAKLKDLKACLKAWNKDEFGHIFDNLNKAEKHASTTQHKTLNQMGRLILIKHVLSPIPLHILAVHSLPISVTHLLHSRMANFFWGSRHGNQLHHWKSWKRLCQPSSAGGLGIKDLQTLQHTQSINLWWRVNHDTGVWANTMRAIYMRKGRIKEKLTDSTPWKRICRVHSYAIIHTNDTVQPPLWDGKPFSSKNTLISLYGELPSRLSCRYIWHKAQTPKLRVFQWRAFMNCLPFPELTKYFSSSFPSQCPLCKQAEDSLDHTLGNCKFGHQVWRYFGTLIDAPFTAPNLKVHQIFISWWFSGDTFSFKGVLRIILPGVIAWHLWKARNLAIHEGQIHTTESIIQQCFKHIQAWSWASRRKKWLIHDNTFRGWGLDLFWINGNKLLNVV